MGKNEVRGPRWSDIGPLELFIDLQMLYIVPMIAFSPPTAPLNAFLEFNRAISNAIFGHALMEYIFYAAWAAHVIEGLVWTPWMLSKLKMPLASKVGWTVMAFLHGFPSASKVKAMMEGGDSKGK